MAKTESYKFHVTYYSKTGEAIKTGSDITLNIPVFTRAQYDAFNPQLAPGGAGYVVLIDYDTGPTPRWLNAQQAGFNPSNNTRLLGFLPSEYEEGTLDWKIQTALYNETGYGVNCFDYTGQSPTDFWPMLLWQDGRNVALMVNKYVTTPHPAITGEIWERKTANDPFTKSGDAGEIPMFLGLGKNTRCGFMFFVDDTDGLRKIASYEYMTSRVILESGNFQNANPWGGRLYTSDSAPLLLRYFFTGAKHETFDYAVDNPYQPGGDSGSGGGGGNFDNSSDLIPAPGVPAWSATQSGFISIFNPTLDQVQQLASFLWSAEIGDQLAKLLANPLDVIISFHALPLNIPEGTADTIKVGPIDTAITAWRAKDQWVELDCGSIDVKEYWGGFMDYAPYTKISIYLPYCGTYELAVDDIMNKPLNVKYLIDILTGACIALISAGGSVLYQFTGSCRYDMPVSSPDYRQLASSITAVAISAIGVPGIPASQTTTTTYDDKNQPIAWRVSKDPGTPRRTSGLLPAAAAAVVGSKINVQRTGSIGGNTGILGVQFPYLLITRPKQIVAANQGDYVGFPSWTSGPVGSFTGFTKFREVHLENVNATQAEIEEIHSLLTSGVIV